MFRSMLILLVVAVVTFANVIWVGRSTSIQEADMTYLIAHCPVLKQKGLNTRLVADGAIDGTLYLTAADYPGPAIEVGFRSAASQMLCSPWLGCLTAPKVGKACL